MRLEALNLVPKLMAVIEKDCEKNTNSSFLISNVLDNYSAINTVIKTKKWGSIKFTLGFKQSIGCFSHV